MENLVNNLRLTIEYVHALWGVLQLFALLIITLALFVGIYSLTKLYNLSASVRRYLEPVTIPLKKTTI